MFKFCNKKPCFDLSVGLRWRTVDEIVSDFDPFGGVWALSSANEWFDLHATVGELGDDMVISAEDIADAMVEEEIEDYSERRSGGKEGGEKNEL